LDSLREKRSANAKEKERDNQRAHKTKTKPGKVQRLQKQNLGFLVLLGCEKRKAKEEP